MQRIINITIGGVVIPIEELAYSELDSYISSLELQFAGEMGRDEIIQDIENRIAELFSIRLQNGAQAIVGSDVQKVIETLGDAYELNNEANAQSSGSTGGGQGSTRTGGYAPPVSEPASARRLYRNPNDKMLGGVCSGLANYFDVDPVILRLAFAIMFFTAGVGLLAYILCWIIIPVPRTPEELYYATGARPMNFETMKKNMGNELQDLKKKGEDMSNELKDFFSKKK